jgi:hypothetical protein
MGVAGLEVRTGFYAGDEIMPYSGIVTTETATLMADIAARYNAVPCP